MTWSAWARKHTRLYASLCHTDAVRFRMKAEHICFIQTVMKWNSLAVSTHTLGSLHYFEDGMWATLFFYLHYGNISGKKNGISQCSGGCASCRYNFLHLILNNRCCPLTKILSYIVLVLLPSKNERTITCIKPQNPNIKLGVKETSTTKVQHSCGCGSKEKETNIIFAFSLWLTLSVSGWLSLPFPSPSLWRECAPLLPQSTSTLFHIPKRWWEKMHKESYF